jgi:mannan endo-1,4-beta-mannosidase
MKTSKEKFRIMKTIISTLITSLAFVHSSFAQLNITYSINTSLERASISPYIYGVNSGSTPNNVWSRTRTENIGSRRLGGNRLTTFNWENNYSNAGSDFGPNANDTYIWQGLSGVSSTSITTGGVLKMFHDTSKVVGAYSLVTSPLLYVSKNIASVSTTAPSSQWNTIQYAKGSAFTLAPSNADGIVYSDEMVNWLVNQYGNASTLNGVKGYSLDNEPDLWNGTHPLIHPSAVTCNELVTKSIQLATAIKNVDANAEVFGYASYGWDGYTTLQGASDWGAAPYSSATYPWFIDAYLDKMKVASTAAGKRLVDVLDIHYYSEHKSTTGFRVWNDGGANEYTAAVNAARIQAPRSLWDPNFIENSYIATYNGPAAPIQLIPTLKNKISTWWPGTKIGITEWSFSGTTHISGGLAVADALGIFGKQGVYFTTYWGDVSSYISSAYRLYRNYDGSKSTFENTHVKAEPGATSDWTNTSIYASVNNATDNNLHLIVLNKHATNTINATFNITSSTSYTNADVYRLISSSTNITALAPVVSITGNTFTITGMPALSAYHIILHGTTLPVTLISFEAKSENDQALLSWQTVSEEDIKFYQLYKSNDGSEWNYVGQVNANNSENINEYTYTDTHAGSAIYYKLVTVNLDGKTEAQKVVRLTSSLKTVEVIFSPNPFTGNTRMEISGEESQIFSLEIKNFLGEIVSKQNDLSSNTVHEVGETLEPGVYWINVTNGTSLITKKIIKVN